MKTQACTALAVTRRSELYITVQIYGSRAIDEPNIKVLALSDFVRWIAPGVTVQRIAQNLVRVREIAPDWTAKVVYGDAIGLGEPCLLSDNRAVVCVWATEEEAWDHWDEVMDRWHRMMEEDARYWDERTLEELSDSSLMA